eukprot:Gregarina_sp_Poly_1__1744@NODE_144_length_12899_cov_53_943501_g129_i0_p3_GENE_NODE_144_length_12899_cov_53_943501_g129_i0NODE_144_length_12899_cov_53_943501_g129_i0_p3_ORF_typecomplete_len778_score138_16Vps52/PF04129_12/1_9e38Sec3_C/PF09763_9/7_1e14MitMem_reg/PF13012_6/1Baculo_PEP_C/PF04513_12/0_041Baculo_PEP_C/PF04513_12/7_1e02SNF5/PF04855_12/4_4e03SNF5/PF04855_12/0_33_NODE_144_length_12899_cov_53_943501_g129_i037536086
MAVPQILSLLAEFDNDPEVIALLTNSEGDIESKLAEFLKSKDAEIEAIEEECIGTLTKESSSVNLVLENLDLSCHKLQNVENSLETFSNHLTTFLGDVAAVQKQSTESLATIARNKQFVALMTSYINKIIVTPSMTNAIQKLQPSSPRFIEALEELKLKLCHAEEPGFDEFPSSGDCRRAIYELRAVAVEKCKVYLHSALADMFRKVVIPRTSLPELQKEFRESTGSLFHFLSSSNPLAAVQIRQSYIKNASKLHFAQAQTYLDSLFKLPIKMISEKSVFYYLIEKGIPESCLNFEHHQSSWLSSVIVPQKAFDNVLINERSSDQDFQARYGILSDTRVVSQIPSSRIEFPEFIFKQVIRVLFQSSLEEWNFQQLYFFSNEEKSNSNPLCRRLSIDSTVSNSSSRTDTREAAFDRLGLSLNHADPGGAQKLFEEVYHKTLVMVLERLDKLLKDNFDVVGLSLMWKIVDNFKQEAADKQFKFLNSMLDSIEIRCLSQLTKIMGLFNMIATKIQAEESQLKNRNMNPFLSTNYSVDAIINVDIVSLYGSMATQVATVILSPPRGVSNSEGIYQELQRLVENVKGLINVAAEGKNKSIQRTIECQVFASSFHMKIEAALNEVPTDPSVHEFNEKALALISDAIEWTLEKSNELGELFAEQLVNETSPKLMPLVRKVETHLDEAHVEMPRELINEFEVLVDNHNSDWSKELKQIHHRVVQIDAHEVRDSTKKLLPELLRQAFTKYLLFHSRLATAASALGLAHEGAVPSHVLVSLINTLTI